MPHIRGRFTDEQVKVLRHEYGQGQLAGIDLQEPLGIGKSRFFALQKATVKIPRDSPSPIGGRSQESCLPKRKMRSRQLCCRRKPLSKVLTCQSRARPARPSRSIWRPRDRKCW